MKSDVSSKKVEKHLKRNGVKLKENLYTYIFKETYICKQTVCVMCFSRVNKIQVESIWQISRPVSFKVQCSHIQIKNCLKLMNYRH